MQEAFFKKYSPLAVLTHQMTGIPASVILGQAALESGFGKHNPGNNFFGIKGRGPAGSQTLWTYEYHRGSRRRVKERFRKYHDPLESFLDHAQLLSESPYFKRAMDRTHSPREFLTALQSQKVKYATDPQYSAKVMAIINRFKLTQHDLF